MKTIPISASTEYEVLIGGGLLSEAGEHLRAVTKADTVAVVSDSNVWPLYGHTLSKSLELAGFKKVISYVMTAGEESKNAQTYLSVLDFLAMHNLDRSSCIAALGGGVVGDLAGFAAATYLRGVDYVQIPTSLLAMVDSSVGGKTAIDLKAGKNLAGAFYQPKLVLCDADVLSSLPETVFRDGCAEVIKYGVLYDADLLTVLESTGINFDPEAVIARCVELKRDVVTADEFDRGQRMLLNLGHTVGHGIEAASNYTVSHGQAVSIGMAVIARACAGHGICSHETALRISTVLKAFGLPVSSGLDQEAICSAALSDKKRIADTVHLVVPRAIGCCEVLSVAAKELPLWIQAGLQL